MGEGVSSALKLITELVSDRRRLFVIEEPETDLHPAALRDLLEAVGEAVDQGSQFLVSTHNEQVLRYLGAINGARVVRARLSTDAQGVPLTTYSQVEGSFERREALADLGYEDTLPMGWLVLEESTMEQFLTTYLIPTFAPKLAALRTISAKGAGKVPQVVEDLHRFALFAHLTAQTPRLWVIVDGDVAGNEAVAKLQSSFRLWPETQFQAMSAPSLEALYPDQFAELIAELGSVQDWRLRREKKAELLRLVLEWCAAQPTDAKKFFSDRASSLIRILSGIENVVSRLELP